MGRMPKARQSTVIRLKNSRQASADLIVGSPLYLLWAKTDVLKVTALNGAASWAGAD